MAWSRHKGNATQKDFATDATVGKAGHTAIDAGGQ